MAKFDVHRRLNGPGYLLDLQANILDSLTTRFVAPLLPLDEAPRPAARLNPIFGIDGEPCVMVTQFAGAVPASALGDHVGSLRAEETTILDAIDMLIGGY